MGQKFTIEKLLSAASVVLRSAEYAQKRWGGRWEVKPAMHAFGPLTPIDGPDHEALNLLPIAVPMDAEAWEAWVHDEEQGPYAHLPEDQRRQALGIDFARPEIEAPVSSTTTKLKR
jgi:hypothetical protein